MAKKLDYEFIKKSFEDRRCILKSTEYVDAHTKLDYICPNGHEHSIRWADFQQGKGCKICGIEKRASSRRYGIDHVKKLLEKKGWLLRSTEYINSGTKFEYTCDAGHEHSMTFSNFLRGVGCPTCQNIIQAKLKRHSIEYIRDGFNKKNCILKSTEYINNKQMLDYVCDKGHEHTTRWDNFLQSNGCPTCYLESIVGAGHPSWKGGISCDPYCDAWADKEYKESIKQRDGYKCQNPYCSCNGGILCLHHIDFNKFNCHPSNLITVCNSCNSFANKDREWHIAWYQAFMSNKYGYVY